MCVLLMVIEKLKGFFLFFYFDFHKNQNKKINPPLYFQNDKENKDSMQKTIFFRTLFSLYLSIAFIINCVKRVCAFYN